MQHGPHFVAECAVESLGHTIELRRVWGAGVLTDPPFDAVCSKLIVDVFSTIVGAENKELAPGLTFDARKPFSEETEGLVLGVHQENPRHTTEVVSESEDVAFPPTGEHWHHAQVAVNKLQPVGCPFRPGSRGLLELLSDVARRAVMTEMVLGGYRERWHAKDQFGHLAEIARTEVHTAFVPQHPSVKRRRLP